MREGTVSKLCIKTDNVKNVRLFLLDASRLKDGFDQSNRLIVNSCVTAEMKGLMVDL